MQRVISITPNKKRPISHLGELVPMLAAEYNDLPDLLRDVAGPRVLCDCLLLARLLGVGDRASGLMDSLRLSLLSTRNPPVAISLDIFIFCWERV